jgi:hypothetical protein
MNSYLLAFSGYFAGIGVPILTLFATWRLWRRQASAPRKILSTMLALSIGTGLFVWLQWFHNPLPSDATLIKHFSEHRAEFDQLMKGVRNYRLQVPPYIDTPEGKELSERLKIYAADAAALENIWFPDPYSEKIARLRGQYYGHSAKNVVHRTPQEQVDYWKINVPELFEGAAPITMAWQMARLAGPVRMGIGTIRKRGITANTASRLVTFPDPIRKAYWHFPQPPRVEDGWLLDPGYDLQDRPAPRKAYRVFASLDGFPPTWKRAECVLKRIDAHWFIAMCRAHL